MLPAPQARAWLQARDQCRNRALLGFEAKFGNVEPEAHPGDVIDLSLNYGFVPLLDLDKALEKSLFRSRKLPNQLFIKLACLDLDLKRLPEKVEFPFGQWRRNL